MLSAHLRRSLSTSTASLSPNKESMTSLCEDPNGCRTIWSIVLSSLVTTLACTWAAVHPNVSFPTDTRKMGIRERYLCKIRAFLRERMIIFLLVIISPEFILVWAIKQRLVAELATQENLPGKSITIYTLFSPQQPFHLLGMTRRHGFLVIMGGFYFYDMAGNPHSPVERYRLYDMLRRGEMELPTNEEIQDKGNGNLMIKLFVLIQASWFILQCIVRGFNSMHVTKLEILTISYVMVNFSLWLAWWDKPWNLDRPVRSSTRFLPIPRPSPRDQRFADKFADMMLGIGDDHVVLPNLRQVPTFYSGFPTDTRILLAIIIAFLISSAFAGINCIAWSYKTSFTELVLWRLSSLAIFGLLIFSFMSLLLYFCLQEMLQWNTEFSDWLIPRFFVLWGLLYIAARIQSIVLAFMELKSLPIGAYQTFHWVNYIPHI